MTVQDIMTKSVIVVTEDTPVVQVASLLLERRFSGVPVLGQDQKVLGIITANELFTADHTVHIPTYAHLLGQPKPGDGALKDMPYAAQQISRATAKDVMNQNVLFVRPDLSVEKLAAYIGETWTDAVPVTDDQNRLLGIVTKTDLAKMVGNGAVPPTLAGRFRERPIDRQLKFVQTEVPSQSIIAVRANVWFVVLVVFLMVGLIVGVAYALGITLHIHR